MIKRLSVLLMVSLLTFGFGYAQGDKQVVSDPTYKTRLQGEWAKTPSGGIWTKFVIEGDYFRIYTASPSDGEWTDVTGGRNTQLTSFMKITERSDYDGKRVTRYVAYTDEEQNGVYTAFHMSATNDREIMVVRRGDRPNYSLRTGEDMNKPLVTEGLIKRAKNFNPWQ